MREAIILMREAVRQEAIQRRTAAAYVMREAIILMREAIILMRAEGRLATECDAPARVADGCAADDDPIELS